MPLTPCLECTRDSPCSLYRATAVWETAEHKYSEFSPCFDRLFAAVFESAEHRVGACITDIDPVVKRGYFRIQIPKKNFTDQKRNQQKTKNEEKSFKPPGHDRTCRIKSIRMYGLFRKTVLPLPFHVFPGVPYSVNCGI